MRIDNRRPRRAIAAASIASLALSACETAGHEAHTGTAGVARDLHPLSADTLWVAALDDDAGAGAPEMLAADSANVYVADPAMGRIVALHARTGAVRWSSDRLTDTALTHLRPALVSPRRGGGVFVYDWTRSALLVMSGDGAVVHRIVFEAPAPMQAVCELPDSSLLIAHEHAAGGAVVLDRHGRRVAYHPLPWPDLVRESTLLNQFSLTPTSSGCLATLNLGRGFAEFTDGAFRDTIPYVEPVSLPRLTRAEESIPDGIRVTTALADHSGAATSVGVTHGDIVMSFGGHTTERSHLLDVYDLRGRYRASFRTETRVSLIAAGDSALFALAYRGGRPVVVALRWPPHDTAHAR